jgi:uncharacterized membrane protein YeaQ/YmgE (transglycosylase-associated protein family)
MNSLLWVLIGGTLGLVFGGATVTGASLDIAANVVAGIVGALLGGWLLSSPFGPATLHAGEISVPGLLVAPLGALALLALEHLVRLSRFA